MVEIMLLGSLAHLPQPVPVMVQLVDQSTYCRIVAGFYQETILPVVPMFHVNAWGVPYSALMAGAKLVLPGPKMGDGEALYELMDSEDVTMALGVAVFQFGSSGSFSPNGAHSAEFLDQPAPLFTTTTVDGASLCCSTIRKLRRVRR